ncbi:hypothetical protein CHS0354_037204 [Potamilus streckersoni]|nr:hypothetical protein CHS0354_037204 [Potamilus streckersoni]
MELQKQNDIVQEDAVEPMGPSTLATTTEDANKDTNGGIDLQALKEALDKLRQGHDEKQEDVATFLETPIELPSDHQKEIDLTSSSNDWKKLAQEMQKQRDELFLLNGGNWAGVVPSEDNHKLVEVLRQKEIKLVENQLLGDVEKARKLGISVNDIISDMQKSSLLSKSPSLRR